MDNADVIIIGAGPIGCATAHTFADKGARVLMCDMAKGPLTRPVAEVLFPPTVQLMRRWGVELPPGRFARGTGITFYEHGHPEPVELRFPAEARPLMISYTDLADAMQESLIERYEIELLHGVEILSVELDGSVHATRGKFDTQYRADLLVGADGRTSVVRRRLYGDLPETVTSLTASAVLEGTGLKGYEQVRVITDEHGRSVRIQALGRDLIGVGLDLPSRLPAEDEVRDHLKEQFWPLLPPELHEPLDRAAAEEDGITWTAEGFRTRRSYEHGRIAMVGDAVGHVHPLVGIDPTMGFLDGQTLARYGRANGYATARPEAVGNIEYLAHAFYRVLMGRTPETVEARRGLHEHLRRDPAAREAAMWLLAADERGEELLPLMDELEGIEADDEDEYGEHVGAAK
ncbi:FAD-dependent oxidoreductase [Streptomyces broussonetiae]|uniref:NAD(P)/FAD-dependent oxidoreductase n=1 Tax=Streptomyces broussonetiae TaxID=2686304 RepID=A0ABV5EGE8_9ACTN